MIKRRLRDSRGSARCEGSLTDGSRVFAAGAAVVDGKDESGCAEALPTNTQTHGGNRIYLCRIYGGTGVHREDVFLAAAAF